MITVVTHVPLNILDYHALTTKEVGDHRITLQINLKFLDVICFIK